MLKLILIKNSKCKNTYKKFQDFYKTITITKFGKKCSKMDKIEVRQEQLEK
jgi:hypothetical protein